jgi:hypothetical protein
VPWRHASQQVWLRPSRGTHLVVRDQHGAEVARHALAARKGATVLDPAHYAGLRTDQPRGKALLTHVFLRRFPDHSTFVEGLVAQQATNAGKHLRVVLALAEVYSAEALGAALAAAREYNCYSHRFVRGLLEAGDATRPVPAPGPAAAGAAAGPRVDADLGVYQRLLEPAP